MSQEIIKKFGPVLNSIDTNMIMQSSFLESMYNIAAESERRTTSLLTKILNVLDGQKNAMMTNVSRDTIAKEYSFVKSNLKNIFQEQNKESNNKVNQLFTNYSSELLNAMTVNNENLSEMVSRAIDSIPSTTEENVLENISGFQQNNDKIIDESEVIRQMNQDEDSNVIVEGSSYQKLIYEENVKQTSLLERLVGIGEQNLENYEDAERRRLLSDPPSNQDDDSQNQDGEGKDENKRERPKLGTIGKILASIGAIALASPFILGFIEGFFGKKIGELIDAMKQKALEFLSDPKVLLGIGALVAALGLLLRPISTLITGFKLLRGMLKLGGKAITGLGKMLGKLNLGKMFKNAFKGFGNFFKGSLGKITDMFKGSVGKISTLGASVADSVKSAGKSVANRLKNVKTAGGKGLLGGLFGALAGTSAATSTTTTPNRTPALDSTDDARARATQNAVGEIDTTASKGKTSVSNPDKAPNVQTDVGKTQPPVVPGSPDVPKPTPAVNPNRTAPTIGQVTMTPDGRPIVSSADDLVSRTSKTAISKSVKKSVSKFAWASLPFIGGFIGSAFAAERFLAGDTTSAGLQMGAALADFVPGLGTAASIGMDLASIPTEVFHSVTGMSYNPAKPEHRELMGKIANEVKSELSKGKNEREYERLKSEGATPEQLSEFRVSNENSYMSSAAAKITPGMAIGLGGVTTSTEPKGGYQSSTAMALSQTEINRIREIQGLPPTPKIVPPTSKDTNLGKKVDQMSSESSAMQSRGAPVVVRGGDNMMKGGDVIKGGDTTIINNTVIESENFRNHIPT